MIIVGIILILELIVLTGKRNQYSGACFSTYNALSKASYNILADIKVITKYTKLQERFITLGGYEFETKISKVLAAFDITDEMLKDFAFLEDDELIHRLVIENPNKIADMVEIVEVIPDTGGIPFSPRIKSDDGQSYLDCPRVVTDLVYTKAKDWYGEPLPYSIEERIATELYGDIVLKAVIKLENGNKEETIPTIVKT